MKPKTGADPTERMSLLIAERNRKMAVSAHAYVRGSTARFYEGVVRMVVSAPVWQPVGHHQAVQPVPRLSLPGSGD